MWAGLQPHPRQHPVRCWPRRRRLHPAGAGAGDPVGVAQPKAKAGGDDDIYGTPTGDDFSLDNDTATKPCSNAAAADNTGAPVAASRRCVFASTRIAW